MPVDTRKLWEEIKGRASASSNGPDDAPPHIFSSAQFVAGFVPPDYLIDDILQRRFFYSLTGKTGAGKTAICLLLAAHVDQGLPLCGREIPKGQVLYFAGENPDDVRMRWFAVTQQLGLTPADMGVHFVPGVKKLSEVAPRIQHEVQQRKLDLSFVVVDTSHAYFEGTDENDNVQAGKHARQLRTLVDLPSGPTVVACCHPPKNASDESLVPRGGGAYLNEVDGNLACRQDGTVELHWQAKFRGPDFAPLSFQLKSVTHEHLKDSRGQLIRTVVALPLSEQGQQEFAAHARHDEDAVLKAMAEDPTASSSTLAKTLGWFMKDGEPYGVKVRRAQKTLQKQRMLRQHRGVWQFTTSGLDEVQRLNGKAQ